MARAKYHILGSILISAAWKFLKTLYITEQVGALLHYSKLSSCFVVCGNGLNVGKYE